MKTIIRGSYDPYSYIKSNSPDCDKRLFKFADILEIWKKKWKRDSDCDICLDRLIGRKFK